MIPSSNIESNTYGGTCTDTAWSRWSSMEATIGKPIMTCIDAVRDEAEGYQFVHKFTGSPFAAEKWNVQPIGLSLTKIELSSSQRREKSATS